MVPPNEQEIEKRCQEMCVYVVVESFMIVFDSSWKLGGRTEDWKKSNATTVPKKCKNEETGNYRPDTFSLIRYKVDKDKV